MLKIVYHEYFSIAKRKLAKGEGELPDVILITGKVNYTINVDPSIFIVDKNHFPLEERIPGVEGLAVEFGPILERAELDSQATKIICHRSQGEPISLSLDQAKTAFLCFAKNGKPIREGGPALIYLQDGSNKEAPIDYLVKFEVI